MPITFTQVREGDLIIADHFNTLVVSIVNKVNELESRVILLEAGSQGPGGTIPATGVIEVHYKDSPRGIQLALGDTDWYPHTFSIVNNTTQTLTILLSKTVRAARGDWSNSVEILDLSGNLINDISLASGASQDVTVAVKLPSGMFLDDQVTLIVNANVGPPHNKQSLPCELLMTVANAPGEPVTNSVRFTQILSPGNLDNLNPSKPSSVLLPFHFDLRYSATEGPPSCHAKLIVTASASPTNSLDDWFMQFTNIPTNNPAPGVIAGLLTLYSSSPTDQQVVLQVRTPYSRGVVDKNLSLAVRVESTDLTPMISAQTPPFILTVRKI